MEQRGEMLVHHVDQGTPEWLQARAGIPTASEFDAIITPLFKPRAGDGVETYLSKKLAERWLGRPLVSFFGGSMEQGTLKEEEAAPTFELLTDQRIEHVGFVTTLDGRTGCSPDGLLDGGGLEIKCPEAHTHCGYLLRGVLPKEYGAQVHGSMLVTGAKWWKFMSYQRGFPPLIITVKRDEEIIDAMREAIEAFNIRLEKSFQQLIELNGGMPERIAA